MIIYSEFRSPRLEYTLNLIFNRILGLSYKIETSVDFTQNNSEVFINYSNSDFDNSLKIIPSGLLSENSIELQNITAGNFEGLPTIYHSDKGDIPFDIFSAVFFMVSRYEEYLPYKGDQHGRYKAEDSLAFKNGFHKLPVVELWSKLLAEKLTISYPTNSYKQKLTIDIDNAWKHLHKGFFRTTSGLIKCIANAKLSELIEKSNVLLGRMPDPADNFEYIKTVTNKLKEPVQFFILVGTKGKRDRAIAVRNEYYLKLLHDLNQKNSVGLHPSYLSFDKPNELEKEYFSLSAVFTNKIKKSRQHFLRLNLPETYRSLIRLGICEEYSMGWNSQLGYRAGISRAFPFYDLQAEKETHLIVFPFVAMDRTLKDYLKLSPVNALNELKYLVDQTKMVGGTFTMLWHNDSLSDYEEWEGWRTVFEQALEYAEVV